MDCLEFGMGLCFTAPHLKRRHCMDVIENIALISALMFAGVSVTVAVLIGFIYFLELLND